MFSPFLFCDSAKPSVLKLIVNSSLVCLNTAISSVLLCLLALLKICVPWQPFQRQLTHLSHGIMWGWASLNFQLIQWNTDVVWDVQGGETLKQDAWYLLIANHLSWTDIVVIFSVFRNKIPMAKFFLKQELLYVPFLGLACWAVDMPFMKRYSRQYLLKNPHKRGADLQSTRRSCARFQTQPTTVVNFIEGTRFSPNKQEVKNPSYQYLLPPKTGGIAYTLGAMGEQFDAIIDVTLAYPENRERPFYDLLSGQMKKIVVRIDVLPMHAGLQGDYFQDKQYKRYLNQWVNEIWRKKDKTLQDIYQQAAEKSEINSSQPQM